MAAGVGGQATDLIPHIQSITGFSNDTTDPRLRSALVPYDEGQFELAIVFLEPLAREGNLTAIFKLGTALNRLGRTDEAVELWRVAAREGEALSQNNLGLELQERGEIAEAEELFRRAAASGSPQAAYNLSAILLDRGDRAGCERVLREIGRSGYTHAFGRLGLLALEISPSTTDLDVLRAIHHLSLGVRQGGATACSGMAVAGLRLGEWSLIEPWLDEAIANVPADGSADWIPSASRSVRLVALLGESRWDDVLLWLNDPTNVTEEVDALLRRDLAEAIVRRTADASMAEALRSAMLAGAGSGLGRFGIAGSESHEPSPRLQPMQFPPTPRPGALDPRIALVSPSQQEAIINSGDIGAMATLARSAIDQGRYDEADFWYLEWVTAKCSISRQLEGLVEYCNALLFPQERFEEAALYFSVVDWLPEEISAPPGFIAAFLTAEFARHFSPLGRVWYSKAWETVDRTRPLNGNLPLDVQYQLILAGLMHGDSADGGVKAKTINEGFREQYLSYVAGILLGLCDSIGARGVSREVVARATNDWIAFRAAREEPPDRTPAPTASTPTASRDVSLAASETVGPIQDDIAELAEFLESAWSQEFAAALHDDPDAPLGFALARGIALGWAVAGEGAERYFSAAEAFRRSWEEGENDLDD